METESNIGDNEKIRQGIRILLEKKLSKLGEASRNILKSEVAQEAVKYLSLENSLKEYLDKKDLQRYQERYSKYIQNFWDRKKEEENKKYVKRN